MSADKTTVLRTLLTFEAKGDKEVAAALQQLADEAEKNNKKGKGALDVMGGAFKAVARDIDAVAGESAALFGRWASDALGVVEAMGSGGVMGAVAAVTLAVGAGAGAWMLWKTNAEAAGKAATEAVKSVGALLETVREQSIQAVAADNQRKDGTAAIKGTAEELWNEAKARDVATKLIDVQIKARQESIAVMDLELKKMAQQEAARGTFGVEALIPGTRHKEVVDNVKKTAQELVELHKQRLRAQTVADKAYTTHAAKAGAEAGRTDNEEKNRRAKEWAAKEKAFLDARVKAHWEMYRRIHASKKEIEMGDFAERARLGDMELDAALTHEDKILQLRRARTEGEVTEGYHALAAREETLGYMLVSERAHLMRLGDERTAAQERQELDLRAERMREQMMAQGVSRSAIDTAIADDRRLLEARIANRAAETEAAIAGFERQREEQNRLVIAQAMQAAATLGQSAAMMVAQPVISEFTGTLEELGNVNRDNYREFSLFSDELPAIIAKKSQAILAGIAAEAAGKAIMELGEAGAMMALGLGYTAIPGMQAQAAPAFASAATHAAAAAVFGGIAGTSLGGAMAIGSVRGSGGLVGLTRAEQEDRGGTREDRGGVARIGGGSSRGGSGGMGGDQGGGDTYLTYVYEAGSAPPDNRRRHAEVTAASVNEANQSWRTRRIIQGRRAA